MAGDFVRMGWSTPAQLAGADPYELYLTLGRVTGTRQDPCVLDVFMSVTSFLAGHEPKPWWAFTTERKQRYGAALTAAATHREATPLGVASASAPAAPRPQSCQRHPTGRRAQSGAVMPHLHAHGR